MVKIKIVGVFYLQNGDFKQEVKKQIMLDSIIKEFEVNGETYKLEKQIDDKVIKFSDGSKIYILPYGKEPKGKMFTHLFIDKSCLELENSKDILERIYKPSLMSSINTDRKNRYEYEGSIDSRINYF